MNVSTALFAHLMLHSTGQTQLVSGCGTIVLILLTDAAGLSGHCCATDSFFAKAETKLAQTISQSLLLAIISQESQCSTNHVFAVGNSRICGASQAH